MMNYFADKDFHDVDMPDCISLKRQSIRVSGVGVGVGGWVW